MLAGLELLHEVAGCFEQVFKQFEFDVGEVSELSVFEATTEFVLVNEPASQGFEGDLELVFDQAEVAVELVEQVESLDFGIEAVGCWHGGGSFRCLRCKGTVAQIFYAKATK